MWDVVRNQVITKYKIILSEGQPSLAHYNLLDHIMIFMWDAVSNQVLLAAKL
jgi:hypothetical protein